MNMGLVSAYIGDVRVSPDSPQIVAAIGSQEEAEILLEDPFTAGAADIVEVSCDRFGTIEPEQVEREFAEVKEILEKGTDWPIIGTIRRYEDGGRWPEYEGSEKQRLETMEAISNYVDAIDIELRSNPIYEDLFELAGSEDLATIVSDHEIDGTPDEDEIYRRIDGLKRSEADIAKIAYKTDSVSDMSRLFNALNEWVDGEEFDKPLAVIPMGEAGMAGRAFFPLFGSCLTYGCVEDGYGTALGQRPVRTLEEEIEEYEQDINDVGGGIPAQDYPSEGVRKTIDDIEIRALKRTP